MKPVEYVSIGGYVFGLENDACETAKKYLSELETFYSKVESGTEVMEGIEERMSELLLEQSGKGGVVTLPMVEKVIATLGKPEAIEEESKEESFSGEEASTRKEDRNTDDLVILYGMDISLKRIISYKTAWFQAPQMLPFEGRTVPVATDVDAYLTCRYGADYMQLPPPEKRHSYHEYAYISFDHEYEGSRKSEKKG